MGTKEISDRIPTMDPPFSPDCKDPSFASQQACGTLVSEDMMYFRIL